MATQPDLIISYTGAINVLGSEITITNDTGTDNTATSTVYSDGTTNHNSVTSNNYITEYLITLADGTEVTIVNNRAIAQISLAATTDAPVPYTALTKVFDTADCGLTETTFEDGVISIRVREWYPVYGNGTNYIKVVDSLDYIADNNGDCVFDSTNNRTTQGFVDADYVKVILQSDSSIQNTRAISEIEDSAHIVLEQDLDDDFAVDDWVYLLAGYEYTVYIKNITELLNCFQPKIAKLSVQETSCCKTCKSTDVDNLMNIFFGIFGVEAQMDSELYTLANANIKTLGTICEDESCKTCK